MYRCCKHCNHTGHHVHEIGWSCEKHDFFVNWNDKECIEKVFECTDCRLSLNDIFKIGVYCNNISIKYVLADNSQVHNDIMVYYKEGEYPRKPHIKSTSGDMVVEYIVCFDNFPVFKTRKAENIELIKKGFNLKI